MKNRLLPVLILVFLLSSSAVSFSNELSSIYSPTGKRDPFNIPKRSSRGPASVENGLFRYQVEQYELKAILRGSDANQILITDPKGNTYILKQGEKLGKSQATVSRILDKEVILTEKVTNYLGIETLAEKILSLPLDEVSEREK